MHIVIARSLVSTKIGGSIGLCCIKVKKTNNDNTNLFVMKGRWMLLKNLKAIHTTTVHVNKTLKTVKCKVNIKQY